MKKILVILSLFLFAITLEGQASGKSKVGLALSGGAAKGFAHIGILMAIDSAGLEIDAIVGTSAGAIVGSLYSIGYSGKEIKDRATSLNWTDLFLGTKTIDQIAFSQKDYFQKNIFDVPFNKKGKFTSYTGIAEAQGIWRQFNDLFYPVHGVTNYNDFNIPFTCVATDILNGEAVVMSEGDITTSVRASMAMPSIFTAVPYGNTKLIDGGLANNFPVNELQKYEVDFIIGVDLTQEIENADEIDNPFKVILQMSGYKDGLLLEKHRDMCDLLINPDLSPYNESSFADMDSLIDIGIQEGLKYYPIFKKLADSLNAINVNPSKPIGNRLPASSDLFIDRIKVEGLNFRQENTFSGHVNLRTNRTYSVEEINKAVDRAYSFQRYRNISYRIVQEEKRTTLIFDVQPEPSIFFNLGLNYTRFMGASLISGATLYDVVTRNSTSRIRLNINENFRGFMEHNQYLFSNQKYGMRVEGYYEFLRLPFFENGRQVSIYNSNYSHGQFNAFAAFNDISRISVGVKSEFVFFNPQIDTRNPLIASNLRSNVFMSYEMNNVTDRYYSTSGSLVNINIAYIFSQRGNAENILADGGTEEAAALISQLRPYPRLTMEYERYFKLSPKWSAQTQANVAVNFMSEASFLDFYIIGGRRDYLRNQITFAGLREARISSNSFAGATMGFQYEVYPDVFIQYHLSAGNYGFIEQEERAEKIANFIFGTALSVGYNSIAGPIEFSLLHSDFDNRLGFNVFLGHAF